MVKLEKPRKRKDITIREDLYQWALQQIKTGKYWNWSHLIESALEKLKSES